MSLTELHTGWPQPRLCRPEQAKRQQRGQSCVMQHPPSTRHGLTTKGQPLLHCHLPGRLFSTCFSVFADTSTRPKLSSSSLAPGNCMDGQLEAHAEADKLQGIAKDWSHCQYLTKKFQLRVAAPDSQAQHVGDWVCLAGMEPLLHSPTCRSMPGKQDGKLQALLQKLAQVLRLSTP